MGYWTRTNIVPWCGGTLHLVFKAMTNRWLSVQSQFPSANETFWLFSFDLLRDRNVALRHSSYKPAGWKCLVSVGKKRTFTAIVIMCGSHRNLTERGSSLLTANRSTSGITWIFVLLPHRYIQIAWMSKATPSQYPVHGLYRSHESVFVWLSWSGFTSMNRLNKQQEISSWRQGPIE